jgi:transposase
MPAARGAEAGVRKDQRTSRPLKRGRPYSEELRSRVIAAVEQGASYREAAARHGVSASVAVKWAQVFRQTGSAAPRPMGGDRRSRLKGERDWVLRRIATAPDLTLTELHRELRARGVPVSYLTLQRFLRKENIHIRRTAAHRTRPASGAGGGGSECRASVGDDCSDASLRAMLASEI